MINHSFPALIFIRACIILLQYTALIESILLILCLFFTWTHPPTQPYSKSLPKLGIFVLATLLTLEVIYYITYYRPHKKRLLRWAKHPAPLSRTERRELFERCISNVSDWNHYLRLWFMLGKADNNDTSGKLDDEAISQIKRDNVREFLLWAFFDRGEYHDEDQDQEDEEQIQEFITRLEELLGRKLAPGRGEATSLRLTIDKVDVRYHSVLWYGVIALVDFLTYIILRSHKFTHYKPTSAKPPLTATPTTTTTTAHKIPPLFPPRIQSLLHLRPPSPFPGAQYQQHQQPSTPTASSTTLSYWYRPHRSRTHHPILFIHGIGIGLWPYTSFLADLNNSTPSSSSSQIGIIALEILPISSRLTSPPLPQSLFLDQVRAILSRHSHQGDDNDSWSRFTLLAHSYGSVLSTHILHDAGDLAPRVHSLVLVDPVSILLHLPDVAYNFTRRAPRTANEWQLWYFASMDLGVAEGLGRFFFWRENIVWRGELVGGKKRKVVVCLAGRDLIVDTRTVARYLGGEGELGELGGGEGEGVFGEEDCMVRSRADPGLEVLWFGGLDHAQVFDTARDRKRVVDVVRRLCLKE